MEEKNKNIFYVYCYLDPRKPGDFNYGEYHFDFEPIWIGKGKGNRIYHHTRGKYLKLNYPFYNKLNKIKRLGFEFIRYKLHENLWEAFALFKEIELIALIGRKNKKTGPLCNLTDGGEGISGHKFTVKQREKTGIRSKAMWDDLKFKEKMKGRIAWNKGIPMEEDQKKKLSISHTGFKQSDETKAKYDRDGSKNSMFGKHHTDEAKQKIGKKNKGRIVSQETREKMSKANKGRKRKK